MANTYYALRIDSAANTLTDIQAALLDYYGAYADPANLDGVRFDYTTSPYLIFRCAAIADTYVQLFISGSQFLWSCGDGISGNNVTNPVAITGTNTTGTVSAAHLVLGPHTLLSLNLSSTHVSRMAIIGQLSNSDYAVLGMTGAGATTYSAGHNGWNTTDAINLYPVTLETGFQSAAGKLYTQALILRNGAVGVELNGDGSIASFQDIHNASYITDNSTAVVGATFLLTTCALYMDPSLPVLSTCLLMEYDPMEE